MLVKSPPTDTSDWQRYGWRAEPDPVLLAREHEAFAQLLADAGAEVVVAPPTTLDAIYAYDPALTCDRGEILLRPGKSVRLDEPTALEPILASAGVPVVTRLEPPATADGGDMFWLDERTLLIGRGYRTNDAGIEAVRSLLPGVDVLEFDLPHGAGPEFVLHLMSFVSPLARDLAVVYLPQTPVRLVQLLREREVELVEVPDEEYDTMGANVLALAPRVALALERNIETRRRLERAGVEMLVYRGDELSKGDGGPTCLTRPLLRSD